MFVILTYDVQAKRNPKVLKTCRKYLGHVQKSVFEGMITEGQLNRLKRELERVIVADNDQIAIYRFDSLKYSSKEILGFFEETDNII